MIKYPYSVTFAIIMFFVCFAAVFGLCENFYTHNEPQRIVLGSFNVFLTVGSIILIMATAIGKVDIHVFQGFKENEK